MWPHPASLFLCQSCRRPQAYSLLSLSPSLCLAALPSLQPWNRQHASRSGLTLGAVRLVRRPWPALWPRPLTPLFRVRPGPAPLAWPRPSPVLGSTVKWCSPSSTLYTSRALLPYVGSSASEAITCITDVPGPGGPRETGGHPGAAVPVLPTPGKLGEEIRAGGHG